VSNDKGRPATGRPSENAAKLLARKNSPAGAVVTPLPLSWAKALIEAAEGPIPMYGSRKWAALPNHSRTKVASTVIAAECWRTKDYVPEVIDFPSRRAREIAEARRPRPGDYMGGPVPWDEVAGR